MKSSGRMILRRFIVPPGGGGLVNSGVKWNKEEGGCEGSIYIGEGLHL
jgi:hypothetical protein